MVKIPAVVISIVFKPTFTFSGSNCKSDKLSVDPIKNKIKNKEALIISPRIESAVTFGRIISEYMKKAMTPRSAKPMT